MSLTNFLQPCPVCGRGVLIPVECLGEQVSCRHCQGRFHARDTSSEPEGALPRQVSIQDRANSLLACLVSPHFHRENFPSYIE